MQGHDMMGWGWVADVSAQKIVRSSRNTGVPRLNFREEGLQQNGHILMRALPERRAQW